MNYEFLESAEFYNRRYHNFSSRIIIPTAVLLVFILLFTLFATKEITVATRATIEPNRIITNIQSTSNNAIITNNLVENKAVKKGDLLVQYQSGAEIVQEATYASTLKMLEEQKQQLEYLKTSIETEDNQFPAPDNFGYYQSFQDYLNQVGTIRANTDQQNATIASQNVASANSQAEMGNLMAEIKDKISDYQTAKSAIQNGTSLASTNPAYSLYQVYQAQAEADSTGIVKKQTIAQVDAQIAQLENTLSSYRVQYAGAGAQQAYSGSLGSQLESLKAQQLTRVGQELTILEQKILDAKAGKEVQGSVAQKGSIIASEDGVLHLNPETTSSKLVPEGTLLAQLYPLLINEKRVKITAYISSKDIASLKVGDAIRFTTLDDLNKQQKLTSTISSIDTTATKTEQGNFFKLEAETKLSDKQSQNLRYGLEGRAVMITGKKTYFQYYVDQFLNKK